MKFLINTITHWEEPPRARHQVANSLAKKHKVVFVAANKFGFPKIKNIQVNENLTVLVPYFPYENRIRYRVPGLNEFYQYWLYRKLVKEYKDFRVINFDFTATKIFNFFDDVIYYCNDNFSAISKHINHRLVANYHAKCESKVATKARFCVSVSTILKENLKIFNPNSYEIPLGSPEISQFNIQVNKNPSENKNIQVGFVGFIKAYNISYDLLNLLLKEDNMTITLIGPVEEKFLDLIEKKDKLILKGSMVGEKLYNELNKFDVAIAIYAKGLLDDVHVGTGSKMYQYFAVGKPIVISNMIGLSKINLPDKFIYVANTEDEFPVLIRKAHNENTKDLIEQRINYAKNNTWDKRMENLLEIYNKV
jgi:hypothetical protein